MKKYYLITVLSLFSAGLMAQGGSWYVGGIAGYNTNSTNEDKNPTTNMWYFGPEVGTFFNENWSAGLVLGLDGMTQKDDDGVNRERSTFAPNLYGRRWWSAGERLNLFAGLDVSFGSGSTTNYDDNGNEESKIETSSFNTNVNAGVAYALANRWTLLLKFSTLGFSSSTEKQEGQADVTTTNFGLLADGNITSGQFIFVGLYYTFITGK